MTGGREAEKVSGSAQTDAGTLPEELAGLLEGFREGKRGALARAISAVEDGRPGFEALLHAVLAGGLRARRAGITGPPGAGKSTLVSALCSRYRDGGEEVGVVAVDPTSPFSGGALLGDRIRMGDLATDPGVFIRSMATRGSLGGLATKTREVIDLLDAFGFPRILVETVGVGQTELEITGAADTVVVVLVPESGDAIQAMKAGLMEIADIFVVNKADRPGADQLAVELRLSLQLRRGQATGRVPAHHGPSRGGTGGAPSRKKRGGGRDARERRGAGGGGPAGEEADDDGGAGAWDVPVIRTVAHDGEGVEELVRAVDAHRSWMEESGELERRRKERAAARIRDVVERELRRRVWSEGDALRRVEEGAEQVVRGRETPYSVARELIEAAAATLLRPRSR